MTPLWPRGSLAVRRDRYPSQPGSGHAGDQTGALRIAIASTGTVLAMVSFDPSARVRCSLAGPDLRLMAVRSGGSAIVML